MSASVFKESFKGKNNEVNVKGEGGIEVNPVYQKLFASFIDCDYFAVTQCLGAL